MEKPFVIVSCVKSKRKEACKAKDMYVSDLFNCMRRYAEHFGDSWIILSAKYGVLQPEDVIEPYEKTLNAMSSVERRAWSATVTSSIGKIIPPRKPVAILAGEKYREGITDFLRSRGSPVSIPMIGLRFGLQLRWIKAELGKEDHHTSA